MGKFISLGAAFMCSVMLTFITVTPPVVEGDWARLDAFGKYVPKWIIYDWPRYELQIFLWMCSIFVVWWAFRIRKLENIPSVPQERSSYSLFLLLPIMLLGFGLRLYTLDRLPLLIDEIGFAARAADMLRGQSVPIFAPGHNGNPSVFSWLLAGIMSIFGHNLFAVRLLSLAAGTLSIPAAYALGRSWWSWQVGLTAAAFLATYPAHVYFSRLALYNIIDPLLALLALAVLARALRSGRLADFAWGGVWAGIAQYFYHGSRLLPILMVIYLIVYFLNRKQPYHSSNRYAFVSSGLGVMFFVFMMITLPRFGPMFTSNLPITGNLEGVRLPADFGSNALRSVLAWVGQPDVSPFWLGSVPLLPLFALMATGIGLVISLRRLRDPRYAVLPVALLLTTLFGGAVWPAAPLYVRYMTALPAIVMLLTIMFETFFYPQAVEKRRENSVGVCTPHWQRWIGVIVIIGIMLQGVILCLQHVQEAYERVPAGLWEADTLARAASHLPEGIEARLIVSDEFGEVERIIIADYIAFYGLRRSVSISK